MDLNRYRPLSAQEEQILFKRYRTGDKTVKNKIILANLRFVVKVAMQYSNQGVPLIDLISEGNKGLVLAVDKFEPNKNFKFISYAVWWIRQSILKGISEQSRMTRIPLNKVHKIGKILKAIRELSQEKYRAPTVEEIAEYAKLNVESVRDMICITTPPFSLDSPVGEKGKTSYVEDLLQSPEEDPLEKMLSTVLSEDILESFKVLTPAERKVIDHTYGFVDGCHYTLKEIGAMMGLSRERARQIREKAIKKMREAITSKNEKT